MRSCIPKEIAREIASCGGLRGISGRIPKQSTIRALARYHEILSDPVRLQILLMLKDDMLCVCIVRAVTDCPDTRLSYHLKVLKRHGLIKSKRVKSFLKYYLTEKGKSIVEGINKV